MIVKINLHGNKLPEQHGEWVDLYTAETVHMHPLDYALISLGYSMQLPEGYYAEVVPRSGACNNYGVIMANSMGVIENTYCGDGDVWRFPAVAIRETIVPQGVRICQFRLVKQADPVEFEVVEKLGNKDRGGLGSTGVL